MAPQTLERVSRSWTPRRVRASAYSTDPTLDEWGPTYLRKDIGGRLSKPSSSAGDRIVVFRFINQNRLISLTGPLSRSNRYFSRSTPDHFEHEFDGTISLFELGHCEEIYSLFAGRKACAFHNC